MRTLLVLSTAALLLSACTDSDPRETERRTEAERQQALSDSAFGPMTDTLDRARGVEQLQEDRRRQLNEALERSGER